MADIDLELAYLRDMGEFSGLTSREAIANALRIINEDRTYPRKILTVTHDGEYVAPDDHPFTDVIVQINELQKSLIDGIVPPFTVTANGTYNVHDMYDKDYIITEFTVNVQNQLKETVPLVVTSNGEYTISGNLVYSPITVSITDAPHEGDLLKAHLYFVDPNNPNILTAKYIATSNDILFGDSALDFLNRFPKLKQIKMDGYTDLYYSHLDWNPDPRVLRNNQRFIPTWLPFTYQNTERKMGIDDEIFFYIAYNGLMDLFYDVDDILYLYKYTTKEDMGYITYVGPGITDVTGNTTHACFSVSTQKYIDGHYTQRPIYCDDTDISDVNTRTPIDGDNYYWWGCSFIRAYANKNRSILVRPDDIALYDQYVANGYTIDAILHPDIYDAVIPVSHYCIHPKHVSTSYRYYTKTVPRDNITYDLKGDTYFAVDNSDIPIDPNTGNQSPKYGGLYQCNRSGSSSSGYTYTFVKTNDTQILTGKTYYDARDGYVINIDAISASPRAAKAPARTKSASTR